MNDGTIEQADGHVTFRFQRRLEHPVDAVWTMLTDPTKAEGWFGGRIEIEPRSGGSFVSYHGNGMGVVDRVVRLEPPTLLEHTFWVDINPGALVTWELHPREKGCDLTLTHSLPMADVSSAASTIAKGVDPDVIVARNAAGWHRLLDKLEAGLDGQVVQWSESEQQALLDRYATTVRSTRDRNSSNLRGG